MEYSSARLFALDERVGILEAQHALATFQRTPVQRLGIPVAALVNIKRREIVYAVKCVGMLLAEYAFSCNERALVQRLGLYVFALGSIEKCEIVHAVERLGMVFAEHALRQCQRRRAIAAASAFLPKWYRSPGFPIEGLDIGGALCLNGYRPSDGQHHGYREHFYRSHSK